MLVGEAKGFQTKLQMGVPCSRSSPASVSLIPPEVSWPLGRRQGLS